MTGSLVQARFRLALDERLTVLSVDDGVVGLLGFSAEDFLTSRVCLKDRIHPGDADLAARLFSPQIEDRPRVFNIRLRHADGRIRCIRGEYAQEAGVDGGAAVADLLLADAKSLWKSLDSESRSAHFQALMENTDDFIFFKDRNHVFTAVSQNMAEPFGPGLGSVDLLGQTDYDIFPEKYADIYYRLEKQVYAGMPVASEVHESLKLDGTLAWMDNHKYPIRDDKGEIAGLFGVVRDISEHLKDQQALAAAEQEYRTIFDGALEGIFRTSIDGRILMENPAVARILGYDSPEDLRRSIQDVGRDVWADQRAREGFLRMLNENADHAVLGYECRFKRKDGGTLWVSLNSRMVFGDQGEPECYEGFFIDITKRKQAETALRRSEESLKEAQKTAGFGNYVGDLSTGNWTSSEVLDQLFGIGKDYERTQEGWAALVHPDDRDLMVAYMRDEILGQKKEFDKEYRIVRQSDGAVRWFKDRGRLERDGQGQPLRMHGIVQDITETKLFEAALQQSADTLNEAQRIAELGSYLVDIDTRTWTSSEVLDQLFGIGKDYARTFEGWAALVHPDERAAMAAYFADEVLGKGQPFDREYRIVRQSDGAVRWVHGLGRLEFDRLGRPVKMYGTIKDITKRKQSEIAMLESEESLKEAQKIAGVGSFVMNLRTGVSTRSDALLELLGVDRSDVPGSGGLISVIHAEDRARITDDMTRLATGSRESSTQEFRIVRPSDGAVRWVHSRSRVEFDEVGKPRTLRGTIQDITERRQADIALRESKELLQLFIEHAPVALSMFDREMRYLAVSRRCIDEYGLAGREVVGHTHDELFPWIPERFKDAYRRALQGETVQCAEDRLERADGTEVWLRWEMRPWRSGDGAIGGIILFTEDISEQKKADAELRASKELLQLFVERAPAALAMLDSNMRYLATSRRWLEIHSLLGRDVIGRSHYEFFTGLPEEWIAEHRRGLAGEELPSQETSRERADGSVQWLRREIIPWRKGDGSVGGIILCSEDITWQKQAEAALQESKDLLQLFIDNAPVAIAMFDREMRYLALSQPWARDHAVDGQAIIGRTHYEVVPDIPERWKETHRRGLAGERQSSEEDQYDRADGITQWIRWEIIPWRTGDGAIGGIVMFYEDITARRQADAALRESKELLQLFIEHAPAALAMFDCEMRYLAASRRWLDEYGLVEEQIIGRVHYEVVPDIPERWREIHRRGLAGETLREDQDRYERADGSVRWIRWEVIPWRTGDGSVGGIILFAEDITEQMEVEERLRLAASVFTNAREGIAITDPSGAILEVNEMFTRITGYTREEALGQNPRLLKSGLQSADFYDNMWRSLAQEGQWSGEIWNRTKNGDVIAEAMTINAVHDASGALLQYVSLFSDITQLKKHAQQLEHVTHYDMLTNLPNRALLADRLYQAMSQAKRRKQIIAVAYLDLDGFKSINDRHGHDAGDRLLTALSFDMKCALREGDTLARLGGDEFVAVMIDLDNREASEPVLTRLLEAAAEHVQVGELNLCVSASIGVTFYPQQEEADADLLLRQADQAMYQAKLVGGNRYHFFDPDHDQTVRGRHENLEHIRKGLAGNEFVLYYQPKVNMRTGKVVGAEALIRWQHPERGLLPPGMFLPVIEDHSLAIELGEWVIDTALAQMDSWREAGLEMPISVNVGALQLQQADFVDRLSKLLAAHPGVKPFSLEIEVLETSALQDVVQTSQVLSSCQSIGVSFALDDFGTGYSSLTYLKRLPASMLKIDHSFVSDMLEDPENLNILEGILGLASAFHRHVIAEGVETVEHGMMLLRLGCELAQGYGIARPMPASELPGWVASWRPDPRWALVPQVHSGNRALLSACVEHRAWLAAFESFLQGKRHAPPALDPSQCRFGVWLDSEKEAGRGELPGYQTFAAGHRAFHELASKIVVAHAQGNSPEGIARLGELHAMCDSLMERLETLQQSC